MQHRKACQVCRKELTEDEAVKVENAEDVYICEQCASFMSLEYRMSREIFELRYGFS